MGTESTAIHVERTHNRHVTGHGGHRRTLVATSELSPAEPDLRNWGQDQQEKDGTSLNPGL